MTTVGVPRLIYHQRALSNVFWLRAATGTSFLIIRASRRINSVLYRSILQHLPPVLYSYSHVKPCTSRLAAHPTEQLEFVHNFYSALSAERNHLSEIEVSISGAQHVRPALNSGE